MSPDDSILGVYDYDSAVACLQHNWEKVFPDEPFRDPQDAIQRMAAEIMELRRNRTMRTSSTFGQLESVDWESIMNLAISYPRRQYEF